MKVVLANGTVVDALIVTGYQSYVQGQNRPVLDFAFPETTSIADIDEVFTEENCEKITLIDDNDNEFIHEDYVIRSNLKKEMTVVKKATPDNDEVSEQRVFVIMAQRTYLEKQVKNLVATQLEQDEMIAEILFGEV